ncbi:unnamed protein product [Miscanthus lutarioriparius]|uniref:Uncharacterized protein n=1 Tax=Miscanthus lutarioriparius TaxID=422564 RepID=A0A811PPT8_9POAL|nr:unnamed protein product [Miscanthus lutarioriparius]
MGDKKLFLFVDVEDKPTEVFCSSVTEAATSNVGHDNVTGPIDSSKEASVSHAIDWDSLEIIPLGQDQIIGAALPVMDEDAMYEFVGLRAEDERAEQARMAAEINLDDVDLQDAELLVDDRIPVYHFRLAYGGVIKPLPDKSQWASVDPGFNVLPPLDKREVERQRKLRMPRCTENKGSKPRGKGMWQVQCKNCLGHGHRTTSPKCPLNGTKKRKSRTKKGKAGRHAGSTKGDAAPSPSIRQKVHVQMQLTMVEFGGTNQITASPRAVTRSQTGEGASNTIATPRKRLGLKKKLTPKKRKKIYV